MRARRSVAKQIARAASVLVTAVLVACSPTAPAESEGQSPGSRARAAQTTTPTSSSTLAAVTTAPPAPTKPSRAKAASSAAKRADLAAGLRSRQVPQRGSGRLGTVDGKAAAPGRGPEVSVRVQVEGGLDVDGAAFARFVLATLNDSRSWSHAGARTFARTDSRSADLRVVLASPSTSAAMCRPLRTGGRLSCRSGDAAVITLYRWVNGITGYGSDRTSYRRYVVNHEVGHLLGRGHVSCPGRGSRAPVMMQQTKGLLGCKPNPWPHP